MTTEAMIKPANIEEQLLAKISEMRQKNLTAKQKDEMGRLSRKLGRSFKSLAWTYFEIDAFQILELTNPELDALFNLVYNRARKVSIFMTILGYAIPLVGWATILPDSETIKLANSTRKLKKILGSMFNPTKIIRENIHT